jgi:hypothetical protein
VLCSPCILCSSLLFRVLYVHNIIGLAPYVSCVADYNSRVAGHSGYSSFAIFTCSDVDILRRYISEISAAVDQFVLAINSRQQRKTDSFSVWVNDTLIVSLTVYAGRKSFFPFTLHNLSKNSVNNSTTPNSLSLLICRRTLIGDWWLYKSRFSFSAAQSVLDLYVEFLSPILQLLQQRLLCTVVYTVKRAREGITKLDNTKVF